MQKWYMTYLAGNAYKGKYVLAETSEQAIKKAKVKNIVELFPVDENKMKETASIALAEKAEHLAEFIVVNFHHCPIDENKCVEDCIWWKEDNCKGCLLKNTEHIKIRDE